MDLFQHPYYRLNKMMMKSIGQWPDQSLLTRCVCSAIVIYFYVSEILCRIRTISNNHQSFDMVRDCMIEMFIQFGGISIFLSLVAASHMTLKILNRIRTDWRVWARQRELNILHDYTELGKKINTVFTVVVYSGVFIVLTEPVVEKIIDIFLKNNTEPGKFILMVDYHYVDEQKYYFYVVTYFNIASVVIGAPVVTNTVMLVSYTLHGSGIFAALRHRLECIGNEDTPVRLRNASFALDDADIVQIAWCIDRHIDAIEYVNLIEAAFRWNFFVSMAIGMMLVNGLGLLILTQPNNLQVTLTCMSMILLLGLLFLIDCVASQILIDDSISIRVCIYNIPWYRVSLKARKLLQFMMVGCNVPCQLTSGNMMILSIRNVWLTAKTALSYFAFVRSSQGL